MPGFSVGKAEKKLGICASSTCPLNFDHVKVCCVLHFQYSASLFTCSSINTDENICYRYAFLYQQQQVVLFSQTVQICSMNVIRVLLEFIFWL